MHNIFVKAKEGENYFLLFPRGTPTLSGLVFLLNQNEAPLSLDTHSTELWIGSYEAPLRRNCEVDIKTWQPLTKDVSTGRYVAAADEGSRKLVVLR